MVRTKVGLALWVVILACFALSMGLVWHIIPLAPTFSRSIPLPGYIITSHKVEAAKLLAGSPVRLKIPKLNVDAPISPVGMTPDGEMQSPSGAKNVGWFQLGVLPGDTGSAVMAGHSGRWANGEGSVFDNLYKLRAGDSIFVEDGKGASTTFVVQASRSYDPKANAADVFNPNDGKAHLDLITCEGTWDEASKSYSKRLVVFADKE